MKKEWPAWESHQVPSPVGSSRGWMAAARVLRSGIERPVRAFLTLVTDCMNPGGTERTLCVPLHEQVVG